MGLWKGKFLNTAQKTPDVDPFDKLSLFSYLRHSFSVWHSTKVFVDDAVRMSVNNNNNTRTIFIVLSYVAKPCARVHSGPQSESRSAPGGGQLMRLCLSTSWDEGRFVSDARYCHSVEVCSKTKSNAAAQLRSNIPQVRGSCLAWLCTLVAISRLITIDWFPDLFIHESHRSRC